MSPTLIYIGAGIAVVIAGIAGTCLGMAIATVKHQTWIEQLEIEMYLDGRNM